MIGQILELYYGLYILYRNDQRLETSLAQEKEYKNHSFAKSINFKKKQKVERNYENIHSFLNLFQI